MLYNPELEAERVRLGVLSVDERYRVGTPNHPEAVEIYGMIREADWAFGDDYFCWKSGGDGDNGEEFMLSLSVWLEIRDKKGLVA